MNAKFEKMQTSTLQKMLTLATTTEADKADIQEVLDARESGVAAAPAPAPESAAAKAPSRRARPSTMRPRLRPKSFVRRCTPASRRCVKSW